jgi:hypothetical protein
LADNITILLVKKHGYRLSDGTWKETIFAKQTAKPGMGNDLGKPSSLSNPLSHPGNRVWGGGPGKPSPRSCLIYTGLQLKGRVKTWVRTPGEVKPGEVYRWSRSAAIAGVGPWSGGEMRF